MAHFDKKKYMCCNLVHLEIESLPTILLLPLITRQLKLNQNQHHYRIARQGFLLLQEQSLIAHKNRDDLLTTFGKKKKKKAQ